MKEGKIAILGNGISASLLAYLIPSKNNVTIIKDSDYKCSKIPEILPKSIFFNSLNVNEYEIKKIIEYTKSHINNLEIKSDDFFIENSINSEKYFIFDKKKLADYFFLKSNINDIKYQKVHDIKKLEKFDLIFDCRGKKSIINDPNYQSRMVFPAKTKCSYIVANVESVNENTMKFWINNRKTIDNSRTFFLIPVGNKNISIGCSYNPNKFYYQKDLLKIAEGYGIHIDEDKIIASGEELPSILKSSTRLNNVIPIGEASESSCPLTEYGILKSINQIYKVLEKPFIPIPIKRLFNSLEMDPHIPMEILYE